METSLVKYRCWSIIDLMSQKILISLTACVSELFVITCTFPGWILYFNQKYLMAAMIWHRNPWVLMAIRLLLWNGIVIELIFGSWLKTRLWPEWKMLILVKKNWRLLLWKNIYLFRRYQIIQQRLWLNNKVSWMKQRRKRYKKKSQKISAEKKP